MLWFICIFVEIRMDLKLLVMQTKHKLNRTIQSLPDTVSIDQLIDQLIFMEKVELGYQQSEDGKVVANEEAKIIIDKWSK
jgi:hypothetical protein